MENGVCRAHRVYLLDFFCSGIQFYLLLSPYLCFISLLYLDLYVLDHTCDTSRIMREAPEFEPYLPHSRAGNAISRILNFAV